MAYLDKQIYNTLTIWVELFFNVGDGMWVLRGYINFKDDNCPISYRRLFTLYPLTPLDSAFYDFQSHTVERCISFACARLFQL